MGFYIRKSLAVGPLRFNLSKGGIGVSGGIRGLRVGTGLRGNYVHMGRGGLYFRQSLGTPGSPAVPLPRFDPGTPADAVGPFQEIESASVQALVDGSGSELLRELNEKRKKIGMFWPSVVVALFALLVLAASQPPAWVLVPAAAVLAVGCYYARTLDLLRKTTVIFYDVEDEAAPHYEAVHSGFDALKASSRVWHVGSNAAVKDTKYHAGANTLVRRQAITLRTGQPPLVKTNIDIPLLPVGRQTLAFMPDRLLVFDPSGVGEVSYRELQASYSTTQFIDSGGAPSDATVIRTTWQYVNRQGGPDRRFKANKQLPVCLYDELHFTSPSGLNEMIHASRRGTGEGLVRALAELSQLTSLSGRATTES